MVRVVLVHPFQLSLTVLLSAPVLVPIFLFDLQLILAISETKGQIFWRQVTFLEP